MRADPAINGAPYLFSVGSPLGSTQGDPDNPRRARTSFWKCKFNLPFRHQLKATLLHPSSPGPARREGCVMEGCHTHYSPLEIWPRGFPARWLLQPLIKRHCGPSFLPQHILFSRKEGRWENCKEKLCKVPGRGGISTREPDLEAPQG